MKRLSSRAPALGLGLEVLVPVILIVGWWIWSAGANSPFFPPLQDILIRFQELWLFSHFATDVLPSLISLTIGFLAASISGIVMGLVLGASRPLRQMLLPLINFYRSIPTVALIPVFIVLLGFGEATSLLIIVLAAAPPTLIAALDGVRSVDPLLKDVADGFRLTPAEKVLGVYLPAASPHIFSGLQVSLQFSFVVMIASEMLGSSRGIGSMTLIAQQSFASADMWAGILLLGVIGYVSNLLLSIVRKRLLRWYDGAKRVERTS